jgi:two-component system sensor histidine kinase TctE
VIARRTLRSQLLLWLLVPLVAIWAVDAVLTHRTVEQAMNAMYDRSLYASALAISEHIAFTDGRLVVDLPPVAFEMLDTPDQERIFYRVSYQEPDKHDVFVAGYPDLPPAPADASPRTPVLYEQDYRGHTVRIAALRSIPPANEAVTVLVQVAETVDGRKALTGSLIGRGLVSQALLIVIAAGLVWFVVTRGLTPLAELGREMARRSANDLAPLRPRRVPQEVSPLIEAINQLMARVRDAIAAQRRFVADASHQLRTPLAVLRTQAELALRQDELGPMKEAVAQLRDHSQATSHLASQLLSLARAEPALEAPSGVGPMDLAELAREACSALVPHALARRVDLGFEAIEGAIVRGQSYLVREMISNLVENAMRYGAPGGTVTVKVEKPDEASFLLVVEDDGPGIPHQERGRVFERFYRIPGSPGEGAGLGLSIVREIARGHGATVRLLDGAEERGLRVEVRFAKAVT